MRNGLRPSSSESGFALVLALACLIAIGIVVTAVLDYTVAGSRSATTSNSRQNAYSLAEMGLDDAYAILNNWHPDPANLNGWTGNNAASPTLLGCNGPAPNPTCTGLTFNDGHGGSANVVGILDKTLPRDGSAAHPYLWTITSTGTAPNPAGGAPSKKTISASATVTAVTSNQANDAVWNYVFSTAPQGSGCEVNIDGTNVVVDVPVYVTGDLCMSGGGIYETTSGQAVDVQVQGKVVWSYSHPGGTIGTSTAHVTSAEIGQGCQNGASGTLHACSTANGDPFYTDSVGSPSVVSPPAISTSDLANDWAGANPGPKHPCQSGSTPTFDTDAASTTTSNNSIPTAVDLTPSSSYTCKSSDGGTTGEISWNNSTKVLTVKGSIFIDGSIQQSQTAKYTGKATLYYAGAFNMNGTNTTLCVTTNCDFPSWDPNTNMLLLCSTAASGTVFDLNGTNNQFQGGIFAMPGSTINFSGTNNNLEGPVIGGHFSWNTRTNIHPLPSITSLPPGAPLKPNVYEQTGPLNYTSG